MKKVVQMQRLLTIGQWYLWVLSIYATIFMLFMLGVLAAQSAGGGTQWQTSQTVDTVMFSTFMAVHITLAVCNVTFILVFFQALRHQRGERGRFFPSLDQLVVLGSLLPWIGLVWLYPRVRRLLA